MDRKAGIDDYDFIRARCEELKKEREPKPRCPRHAGGSCQTSCDNWSDCHIEWRKRNPEAPTGDFC